MNKKIEIYIACGSGIATSTVVQEKVKQILAQSNIQASIKNRNGGFNLGDYSICQASKSTDSSCFQFDLWNQRRADRAENR